MLISLESGKLYWKFEEERLCHWICSDSLVFVGCKELQIWTFKRIMSIHYSFIANLNNGWVFLGYIWFVLVLFSCVGAFSTFQYLYDKVAIDLADIQNWSCACFVWQSSQCSLLQQWPTEPLAASLISISSWGTPQSKSCKSICRYVYLKKLHIEQILKSTSFLPFLNVFSFFLWQ